MARRQDGISLLTVLVLMLVLTMFASVFVWRMRQDLTQAGRSQRGAAALYLAEAGAEKALWYLAQSLEAATPGNSAASAGYQEQQGSGRFVIETLTTVSPGTFEVTVRGEVADTTRRIRVTARLVPKALGFGLYAGDAAAVIHQAKLYVVPAVPARKSTRRLGDIGVAQWLWVEEGTKMNTLDGEQLGLSTGAIPDYALYGRSSALGAGSQEQDALPDLVAIGGPTLAYGRDRDLLYDVSALRYKYPTVHVRSLRSDQVTMPGVDLERYTALAQENQHNVALNRTVGEWARDRGLREKRDSYYSQEQMEWILAYLSSENRTRTKGQEIGLKGVVFANGVVTIRNTLRIDEGALVVRGIVGVMQRAQLEVRHGSASAGLPGVIAFSDGGRIRVAPHATVVVDGVVLASTGLEVVRARLEVTGAILTGQGLLNDGGLVTVRYQPSVLGTIGLRSTNDVLLLPVSWREIH
jgi:hypothetical protein